jgi:16S rRNA G966 N2-methylase RsmD
MEVPIISLCNDRLNTHLRANNKQLSEEISNVVISTGSADTIALKSEILDYVFIDPPFGANLNYSELSYIWESWLRVITNNKPEAIENAVQKKGAYEYRQLMTSCFRTIYNLLKSGHWITIEF